MSQKKKNKTKQNKTNIIPAAQEKKNGNVQGRKEKKKEKRKEKRKRQCAHLQPRKSKNEKNK